MFEKKNVNQDADELKLQTEESTDNQEEQTSDNTEEKTEESTEDKTEDITEDKTEDKVEDKAEDKTEDKAEDKTEDKTEDNIENKENSVKDIATEESAATLDVPLEPYIDSSITAHIKRNKIIKTVAITLLIVVATVYFGGVALFTYIYPANVNINGQDVAFKTAESVENDIYEEINKYTLEIEFKDGVKTLGVADAGIEIKIAEEVKDMRPNPFLWFCNINKHFTYNTSYLVTFDENVMKGTIDSYPELDEDNMTPSTNAKIEIKSGEPVVIDDVTGTEIDKEKLYELIGTSISDLTKRVSVENSDCYIRAEITSDSESIEKGISNAEDYFAIDAVYQFGIDTIKLTPEELGSMAFVNSEGQVVVSRNLVEDFVRDFSEKYTTVDTDRKFITHDNKKILIHGTYYGWEIDEEAESEDLYTYMVKQEDFVKEPICITSSYAMSDLNDVGDSYVEIDLDDQHVYIYQEGECVFDVDCVSGNLSAGSSTPGGIYSLKYKCENVVLRGPGYASPVSYWMPFNGGIGLHDATWKSVFGGDEYVYRGSHGCINLPLDAAGIVYSYVEVGMPIVCYWDDEVESYE